MCGKLKFFVVRFYTEVQNRYIEAKKRTDNFF